MTANLTVHLRTTPQVVVAAVNGPAYGGGFALACAYDLHLVNTTGVLWHNVDNPSMTAAIALENRNQALASRAPDVQQFKAADRDRTTGARSDDS